MTTATISPLVIVGLTCQQGSGLPEVNKGDESQKRRSRAQRGRRGAARSSAEQEGPRGEPQGLAALRCVWSAGAYFWSALRSRAGPSVHSAPPCHELHFLESDREKKNKEEAAGYYGVHAG